jgi:hypothetical protein
MSAQRAETPTNERIVRLLEEVRADLKRAEKRDERIVRDLERLLNTR